MTLVFGGAFNPPTVGHYEIIKLLKSKYPNDKLILMPVSNKYEKTDINYYYHRYEMLKLLVKDFNNIVISNIEEDKEFLGTINSLNILSKTYNDLTLVIGMDQFLVIESWISYKELLKNYKMIVVNRDSDINKVKSYKEKYKDYEITYLDLNVDTSSSSFRREPITNKNMLTKDVYKYIKNNKLYEGETYVQK